jgi:hypothetical protein
MSIDNNTFQNHMLEDKGWWITPIFNGPKHATVVQNAISFSCKNQIKYYI